MCIAAGTVGQAVPAAAAATIAAADNNTVVGRVPLSPPTSHRHRCHGCCYLSAAGTVKRAVPACAPAGRSSSFLLTGQRPRCNGCCFQFAAGTVRQAVPATAAAPPPPRRRRRQQQPPLPRRLLALCTSVGLRTLLLQLPSHEIFRQVGKVAHHTRVVDDRLSAHLREAAFKWIRRVLLKHQLENASANRSYMAFHMRLCFRLVWLVQLVDSRALGAKGGVMERERKVSSDGCG